MRRRQRRRRYRQRAFVTKQRFYTPKAATECQNKYEYAIRAVRFSAKQGIYILKVRNTYVCTYVHTYVQRNCDKTKRKA